LIAVIPALVAIILTLAVLLLIWVAAICSLTAPAYVFKRADLSGYIKENNTGNNNIN
jgi:hypothetical protein